MGLRRRGGKDWASVLGCLSLSCTRQKAAGIAEPNYNQRREVSEAPNQWVARL